MDLPGWLSFSELKTEGPGRLLFRTGGGWPVFPGLVLLTLGAPTLASVAFDVLGARNADRVDWIGYGALGLVFMGTGTGLVFWRARVLIDASSGRICGWKTLLRRYDEETADLRNFERVEIRRLVEKGNDSFTLTFPITLTGAEGRRFRCQAPRNYYTARERAETVCRVTGLPLHDYALDGRVVEEAETLRQPLARRLGDTGIRIGFPGAPPGERIDCVREDGALLIRLPPRRSLFALPPGARVHEFVGAERGTIHVERRIGQWKRAWSFPAEDIMKLTVTRSDMSDAHRAPRLRIRDGVRRCELGHGLGNDELNWLRETLLWAVMQSEAA